jgi:hypothetical protein
MKLAASHESVVVHSYIGITRQELEAASEEDDGNKKITSDDGGKGGF